MQARRNDDVPVHELDSIVTGSESIIGADPEGRRVLERRASQLCLRAEPHTSDVPCTVHVSEAVRQLRSILAAPFRPTSPAAMAQPPLSITARWASRSGI